MRDAVQSIADIGPDKSTRVASHLIRFFSVIVNHEDAVRTANTMHYITGMPNPLSNCAVVGVEADLEEIETSISPLTEGPFPSAVAMPKLPSTDIQEWLEGKGFEEHPMPGMAVEIAELAETAIPEGYHYSRVTSADEMPAWAHTLSVGYELPLGTGDLFTPKAGFTGKEPEIGWYAIKNSKGEIACVSAMWIDDGMAGIYCVATLPEERGKGLGAHITAQPLREAAEQGIKVGILQSSEMGFPVYQRLGFVETGNLPLYVRIP